MQKSRESHPKSPPDNAAVICPAAQRVSRVSSFVAPAVLYPALLPQAFKSSEARAVAAGVPAQESHGGGI